jgi:amino acid transporter
MFKKLCSPAKFYFIIATISYIFLIAQNINCKDRFYLGNYSCKQNTAVILGLNAIYILVWTWVINTLCTVNKDISWLIVLFPIILFFICLGIVIMNGQKKEREGIETSSSTLSIYP